MATFVFVLLLAVVVVIAVPELQYDLEKAEEYFEAFIQKYRKEYANEDVKAKKFEVFKESLKLYNKKNLEQLNAKFGFHEYSDLTQEEFKKLRGGFLRMRDNACVSRGAPQATPPESYDWQLQGSAVTPVKNQGCSDCFAFSATANIESQYAKKYGKLVVLSEQQILDCDKTNGACIGGDMARAIVGIENIGGQMSLQDYPYKGEENDKCLFNASKVQAKVSSCESYQLKSEDDLIKLLYTQGPLSVGIDADAVQGYNGGILNPCSYKQCDHGVLLVGYGVEGNTKFWRFKNSWGTTFGEDGFFRVERGSDPCGILDCEITSAIVA